VDTDGFAAIAEACARGRDDLLRRGHAPDGRKRLRRFSTWEVCRYMIPLTAAELRAALRADATLPQGVSDSPQGPPRFTLDEVLALRARLAALGRCPAAPARPAGLAAKTLAVANFKGGVGKTSTAASLAMAAALDGYRVLVIDLDSQGSMTSLMGGRVADEWQTAFPLIARDFAREISADRGEAALDETLRRALAIRAVDVVQPTHWPGIDLIGAELNLYWAEFQIPVWRMTHRRWPLWDALGRFLEADGLTRDYDLILLDTPPALGYLTINALAAADILLVPLGASFLEFDSTGRFFDMLASTFASIEEGESAANRALGLGATRFEWDAVRAIVTRYDPAQQAEMAALIGAWFGPVMAEHRQELTALVGQAGEGVSGIYEADPRDFNRETYLRGRETFDRGWAEIRDLIQTAWWSDLAALAEGEAPGRTDAEAGDGMAGDATQAAAGQDATGYEAGHRTEHRVGQGGTPPGRESGDGTA
jgi:chromosome partitioning protein